MAAEQGASLPQTDTHGVFMGYDFHFDGDTPQLIEINTNAGGALLNALLLAHQQVCCDLMQGFSPSQFCKGGAGNCFLDMFRAEWRAAGRRGEPRRVVIVDDNPAQQFLYPEFLLFRKLFESAGWQADIAAPGELQRDGGRLLLRGEPVDLVYNRLTDFALREPGHAVLDAAWREGECVLTPDPWHHALHADKRNLAWLSDAHWLAGIGVAADERAALARIVPASVRVDAAAAPALWQSRRQYFFKPFRGYGSRAAYRGDKLTRGKWEEIVASGDYLAQAYAPPGERRVRVDGALHDMKFDIRCYAYDGRVLLMAARVYQSQTTNMRTAGGGFAREGDQMVRGQAHLDQVRHVLVLQQRRDEPPELPAVIASDPQSPEDAEEHLARLAELRERGVMTSYGSVWRIVREAGVTFKKNAVRRRAAAAEDRPQARTVEKVPGAA